MDNRKKIYATTVLGLILAGCGAREYQPAANTAAADIFAEACQSCHGEQGSGKLGFLLKLSGTKSSANKISEHIRDGGFVMPSFPNIGEMERQTLTEYVKTL